MKIAYLPQYKRRQNIILAILLIGLPLLVFAAYQVVKVVSRAGIGSEPKNVVISNVSSNMISVSWTTDADTIGYITPIEGGTKKAKVADSRSAGRSYTHYVELDNLEANTKYTFLINSEGKEYSTSDGKNLEFSTAPVTGEPPNPGGITGNLKGARGEDVLVYAFLTDKSTFPVSPLGGTVSRTGGWIISINNSRKISDYSLAEIKENTNITVIAVDGRGKTAKIEGTYLELFDSNGELKPTQDFALGDNGDVYSLLPSGSTHAVVPLEPRPPEEPYVPPVQPPDPLPPVDDEPTDDGESGRVYRIVHQLPWVELTEQSNNGASSDEGSFSGAKTIRVVDVTDSGFKVLWISSEKEEGYVNYGTSPTNLNLKALDVRDSPISGEMEKYYVHSVQLDRLQKETKYYFEVISGGKTYDNNGSKYQQSTLTIIDIPQYTTTGISIENMPDHGELAIIGHVEDKDSIGSAGRSKDIFCVVEKGKDQCDLVLGNLRVEDGTAFYQYTDEDILVIEPYTTFEVEKLSLPLVGLEDAGKEISLKRIKPATPVNTTRISALSNYGLTDSPNEVINTATGSGTGTSEIPKTGLWENFLGILIIALILVVFSILLYILTRRKDRVGGKMTRGL